MQTVLEPRIVSEKAANGNGAGLNGGPRPMLWTVEDYYKAFEADVFFGRRVELIRGEIVEMSPMLSPHATSIRLVQEVLRKLFGEGFEIRPQMPMSLGRFDEPEPDVAVVAGSIRDYAEAHPTTAVLVVEVAHTSLRFDRTRKMRLYAENAIGEYWIVNLKQRCVEVFRFPSTGAGSAPGYTDQFILGESESIAPLAMPNAEVRIADLLP